MRQRIIPGVVKKNNTNALNETESVQNALQVMKAYNTSAVCVCDADNQLVGIVSERDIMRHILDHGSQLGHEPQAQLTALREIMVQNPEPLRADDDALDAMELMVARNIQDLPVVSPENRVIAMVSMRDLLKSALKTLNDDLRRARDKAFAAEDK